MPPGLQGKLFVDPVLHQGWKLCERARAGFRTSFLAAQSSRWLGGPELLILLGTGIFTFILALSAVFEADIRWLHFFQAWMYVATAWLGLRRNRWGYFIGVSAAGLWDYGNLFATTFFANGIHYLILWARTGQMKGVDQIIAVPAWLGNLLVLAGCVWGYTRLHRKPLQDGWRMLVAFALTTAFFAADMALCQPRYLTLFPKLLHPHLPW